MERIACLGLVLAGAWIPGCAFLGGTKISEFPEYEIQRCTDPISVDGRMEEASWRSVESVGEFVFPWWQKGPKERTEARLLWDDRYLYVCFVAYDRHISAFLTKRDDPVSRDDCVEVFAAPDPKNVRNYFNFEFNALGTILDRSPRDNRSAAWNAEGILVAITYDGTLNDDSDLDRSWTAEIAVPFESFEGFAPHIPPRPGEVWRLNLYRCGGRIDPQYSAWSDTRTSKPNFHVPERFGVVRFSSARAGAPSAEADRRESRLGTFFYAPR